MIIMNNDNERSSTYSVLIHFVSESLDDSLCPLKALWMQGMFS